MEGVPVATVSSYKTYTQQQAPVQTGQRRSRRAQYIAAIVVNLATFSYGTCVGWPSSAIPTLQSSEVPTGKNPVTEDEASWIGSLMFVGFLCGTPIFGYISDKFGRKVAGLLIAVPAIISWLVIILCSSIHLIFVARFLSGLSTGGVLLLVPIYVGEICEDSIRGTLGSYLAIFGNIGVLFSYVIGSYTLYHDFAIICLSLPVLFLVTFLWMPETPIYLLRKGEVKEAKRSLEWFRGGKGKDLEEELTKMSLSLKEIQERNSCRSLYKDLLLDRGVRRALIIGIAVSATQMLSGAYVILTYTAPIFRMTGSELSPQVSSMIVGSLLVAASILACPLMDRVGRKVLLVFSETVMGICLIALGAYFYLQDQGVDLTKAGFIPVVCLGLHLFSSAAGIGPVNMVLLSELFLPHVRSTSASISTFVMAFTAIVVTKFYSDLNNAIGIYGSYWCFAVCCFLGAIFSVTYVPETKNRDVYSIYAELSGKESSIIPVKKSYNMRDTPKEYRVQGILPNAKSPSSEHDICAH
ncbi:facilitated trehalose transporter Tret1 [Cryptotermes secundus]|uniref:facilitated trehalose transporter Tret1 n=1 Tax=Cryptotermes secundus TaxID=105785 RepID=UPI000CD7CC4A|nr:facilitated trehalose transporter Tret1 [Cryptotermes secundus]